MCSAQEDRVTASAGKTDVACVLAFVPSVIAAQGSHCVIRSPTSISFLTDPRLAQAFQKFRYSAATWLMTITFVYSQIGLQSLHLL